MLIDSHLARTTKTFWLMSQAREGQLDVDVTIEEAISILNHCMANLDPQKRLTRNVRLLQQEIIVGDPVKDKVIIDASA